MDKETIVSTDLVERPQETDRRCSICGAMVVAYKAVMVCHCYEMPWPVSRPSQPPVTDVERLPADIGEIVERLDRYIDALDRDGYPLPAGEAISFDDLQVIRALLAALGDVG